MTYTKTNMTTKIVKYDVKEALTPESFELLSNDIKKTVETVPDSKYFVLAINGQILDFKMLRPLTLLGNELKTKNKELYVLSELLSNHNLIITEGLSSVIMPIQNLDQLEGATTAKSILDVGFVNPFINGVIHVLKVQCGIECQPGKPTLKDKSDSIKSDIAGVIGISSSKFMGSISICFPEKTFLFVMSKMFGEEYSEITKDLEDGAGEVLNMVFGFAKRILNENGYAFDKALPTVVRGNNISLNHVSMQRSIILPFKADEFDFYMEICTENVIKGG